MPRLKLLYVVVDDVVDDDDNGRSIHCIIDGSWVNIDFDNARPERCSFFNNLGASSNVLS